MTGNLKLLCNFVEKFLGTVRFGNDQFAPILGYRDLIQGNVTIKRVYYVEGLNHNLFLDWSILLMWIWSLLSGKILMFLEIFRERFTNCREGTDRHNKGWNLFIQSVYLEDITIQLYGLCVEENNNDQAPNASFQEDEFINPFCTRIQEIGESSPRNIDNTNMHSFQPQKHDYRWTRDHPLEQVRGNPPCS
ncbi:hypothetical protein Tco_1541952 [Tanacetum coccineum]